MVKRDNHKKRVSRKPVQKKKKVVKRVKKVKTKTVKRVQRGGVPDGGTSFTDLPKDILGLLEYTTNSVTDFVESAVYTLKLPEDLSVAFGPNEPNPNNIKIPGEVFD